MPYKEQKKLKNGKIVISWRGQVRENGYRYRQKFQTRKEALEWEQETRKQLKKLSNQPVNINQGMALIEFFDHYLDYSKHQHSKKTYEEKQFACKLALEAFGSNILVQEVTPIMAESFLNEEAERISANRSNVRRKNLHSCWEWGKKMFQDEITFNPFSATDQKPHDRADQYVPPVEDVLKLLAAANREEKVFLDCYLQTGARRSEIFRWKWHEDINFEKRSVRIGTRKTRNGSMRYHELPMSNDLYESLLWLWENRKIKNTPYVFVDDLNPNHPHYGKPFSARQKFMKGICKRAGIRFFGFHSLRRFVASILVDVEKVSLKQVQMVLGHQHISTTERYVKFLGKDMVSTMESISNGLNSGKNSGKNADVISLKKKDA